ncbi:hypothetical protein I79_024252 [Cricetulus griseus]|uniref:Uncharacterized protein n=1 Tax=Cricetulus griseus TaxID=10029 RepID=G3IK60_CRIGR|nr:hypothetical protein I79_024252 [Cricetulus griseus]
MEHTEQTLTCNHRTGVHKHLSSLTRAFCPPGDRRSLKAQAVSSTCANTFKVLHLFTRKGMCCW